MANQAAGKRALESFAVLTDREVLDVQPQRVQIECVQREMSIAQMRAGRASPLSAEQLALLNQVRVDEVLSVARGVKWVVGQ